MFKRLLVPLDGSRLAESVLPATRWLAEKLRATVVLFHVVEAAAPPTIHGEPHLKEAEKARAYLEEIAARLAQPDITVEMNVHAAKEADVARSINEHVTELDVDMIVLCSHGRGGLRDIFVGTIAQQVIQIGTTPVLFIRPEMSGSTFQCRKILVPLDSTPYHEPAHAIAMNLAQACDASLHIITVVPTPGTLSAERAASGMLLPTTMTAVLELAQRGAVEYLQDLAARSLAEGVPTTAQVVRGDVAPAILEMSRSVGADLIVLATHGRGIMDAFWSGSVTPKILSKSNAPVLLVRVMGKEAER